MARPNPRAHALTESLKTWDRADAELARSAGEFLADLLRPNAPRGAGTHAALERLKHHLGFDRYAMPAAMLEQLASEQAAAIITAARKAVNCQACQAAAGRQKVRRGA